MARNHPHIPFERYADDAICHCRSAEEARALWNALAQRFAACKLVLHPEKTKIVYCKDANRRGDFPNIYFDFLGFQFRARKTMWGRGRERILAHSFQPAASPKALTSISRTVRRWALHHRSDKTELATSAERQLYRRKQPFQAPHRRFSVVPEPDSRTIRPSNNAPYSGIPAIREPAIICSRAAGFFRSSILAYHDSVQCGCD